MSESLSTSEAALFFAAASASSASLAFFAASLAASISCWISSNTSSPKCKEPTNDFKIVKRLALSSISVNKPLILLIALYTCNFIV